MTQFTKLLIEHTLANEVSKNWMRSVIQYVQEHEVCR